MFLNRASIKAWHGGRYIALGMLLWTFAACHPPQKKTVVTPTPIKTETPQPISLTVTPLPLPPAKTAAEAVQNGIAFLRAARWEMEFAYLYTYLQDRFHWPEIPAQRQLSQVRDSLRRTDDANARNVLHEMALFDRLIDPNYRITAAQLASAAELDALTVPALYCDVFAIDTSQYFPMLRAESARSGYQGTHAMLCYVWLRERGCLGAGALGRIRGQLAGICQAMIGRSPVWNDLNIEAAAVLKAGGEPIPENWVQGVVDAQNRDGGWSLHADGGPSDTHATILALWFLAER